VDHGTQTGWEVPETGNLQGLIQKGQAKESKTT